MVSCCGGLHESESRLVYLRRRAAELALMLFDMQRSDIKVRITSCTRASCLAEWLQFYLRRAAELERCNLARAALPKGDGPWSSPEQLVPLSAPIEKPDRFLPLCAQWMKEILKQRSLPPVGRTLLHPNDFVILHNILSANLFPFLFSPFPHNLWLMPLIF